MLPFILPFCYRFWDSNILRPMDSHNSSKLILLTSIQISIRAYCVITYIFHNAIDNSKTTTTKMVPHASNNIKDYFHHTTLTQVPGEPNYETLTQLQK